MSNKDILANFTEIVKPSDPTMVNIVLIGLSIVVTIVMIILIISTIRNSGGLKEFTTDAIDMIKAAFSDDSNGYFFITFVLKSLLVICILGLTCTFAFLGIDRTINFRSDKQKYENDMQQYQESLEYSASMADERTHYDIYLNGARIEYDVVNFEDYNIRINDKARTIWLDWKN